MKRIALALLAIMLALPLGACTAPEAGQATAPQAQSSGNPKTVAAPAANPASPALTAAHGTPDLSCKVAADCTVKNVGNCCGYFPACVNKDSAVDPEAVRAECERSGTSSVCGWKDIQACDCVQGQCQAASGPLEVDR